MSNLDNTTQAGNVLIAEFMNLPTRKIGENYSTLQYDELAYHTSWDWLMPVWIKFKSLWDGKENDHSKWLDSLGMYLCMANEPKGFFERLVYAIQWYNLQPKTNTHVNR